MAGASQRKETGERPLARIMVVDDSPTDQLQLKTFLTRNGFDVIVVGDGAKALELVRAQQPDCVLMDVVMPGINGFQATRALSKDPTTAGIPIVVVSSKGQETDRLWALRQGAREYIVKPVREAELISKLKSVLLT